MKSAYLSNKLIGGENCIYMDLYDLQFFPYITRVIKSRMTRLTWACVTCGREEWCLYGLTGKLEGKRLYRRPMHRGEHNIKRSSWDGGSVW